MKTSAAFEFPAEQEAIYRKARRLEWITLAYICSAAALLFLTMGSSQAMRTSFFEDVISTVPTIAFLIGTKIARRKPNKEHPYGFHRATSVAFLTASLSLVGMGLFLLVEAALKLISQERTSIGAMQIAGTTLWAGWPMLAAVAYSAIPAVVIGKMKLKLAPKIHDKVLQAQADMMKADWMAEAATAIGVLGVGFGYWWIDPIAASLVSLDILKDGLKNTKVAVADLMDRRPRRTDNSEDEPVPQQLQAWLKQQSWVREAQVRLREEGHVFFGEVFVVPTAEAHDLPQLVRVTTDKFKDVNWRLHDVGLVIVDRFSE